MTEVLYREFKIDEGNIARLTQALRVFWANAVRPWVAKGRSVLIIVTSEDAKRNTAQNARLWGYVYRHIAEQAWVNGAQFKADVWHEHFAREFGACEDVTLPTGEVVVRRKSSADMSVADFAEFMTRIEACAASELGVVFSA